MSDKTIFSISDDGPLKVEESRSTANGVPAEVPAPAHHRELDPIVFGAPLIGEEEIAEVVSTL